MKNIFYSPNGGGDGDGLSTDFAPRTGIPLPKTDTTDATYVAPPTTPTAASSPGETSGENTDQGEYTGQNVPSSFQYHRPMTDAEGSKANDLSAFGMTRDYKSDLANSGVDTSKIAQ